MRTKEIGWTDSSTALEWQSLRVVTSMKESLIKGSAKVKENSFIQTVHSTRVIGKRICLMVSEIISKQTGLKRVVSTTRTN